jgi:uncharacterized membrane protein
MPICARCTGIWIGAPLAMIVSLIVCVIPPLWLSCILIFPTAVDGFMQYRFGKLSTNRKRLYTGLLAGLGIGWVVLALVVIITHIVAYVVDLDIKTHDWQFN